MEKSTGAAKMMDLPIFKNYDDSQIMAVTNSFRKGEKGINGTFRLILAGLLLIGFYFAIPFLLATLKLVLGLMITLVAIITIWFLAPVFLDYVQAFSKFLAKRLIENDPFGYFAKQRIKMIENKRIFNITRQNIRTMQSDMEAGALTSQNEANEFKSQIDKTQIKTEHIKTDLATKLVEKGEEYKSEDEYIEKTLDLRKLLSSSSRLESQYNQSRNFVSKYGLRGRDMKKFGQKLDMMEVMMDNKLLDFDATVVILKNDYDFARKTRAVTDAAKEALYFTKEADVEYASQVIMNTINNDLAITSANLNDINSLAGSYSIDDDELFANLDKLANDIRTGASVVPSAKAYKSEDYKLTDKDQPNKTSFSSLLD